MFYESKDLKWVFIIGQRKTYGSYFLKEEELSLNIEFCFSVIDNGP